MAQNKCMIDCDACNDRRLSDLDSSAEESDGQAERDEILQEQRHRDKYAELFDKPWSPKLSLRSGAASNQVLINGQSFDTNKLNCAIAAYMAVGPVAQVKLDVLNKEAHMTLLTAVNVQVQVNKVGQELRKLKVNLHNLLGCEIPLLLSLHSLTALSIKQPQWTNKAYIDAHFGAIKLMTKLRDISYKFPSYLDDDIDPGLTRDYVADLMAATFNGKWIRKAAFVGLSQMGHKQMARIVNSFASEDDGLTLKLKRCGGMRARDFGELLIQRIKKALHKLEVQWPAPSAAPDYSIFSGANLANLTTAKLYHQPDMSPKHIVALIKVFMPNILALKQYKNGFGFKLGVNCQHPAVLMPAMMQADLIDQMEEYNDGTDKDKPYYAWLCRVAPLKAKDEYPLFFRVKVHIAT